MNTAQKVLGSCVAIVIFIGILYFIVIETRPHQTNPSATLTNNAQQSASATTTSAVPKPSPSGPAPAAKPHPAQAAAPIAVWFITPVAGDLWHIGSSSPIIWNASSGTDGQLYLIDAKTKSLVGIILNAVGPAQTSYTWDTRYLEISSSDPAKILVQPGMYNIVLSAENRAFPVVTSPTFTIEN